MDGITLATNDRVLLKDQTTASENGIYQWNGAAAALTRTTDGATFTNLEAAVVGVEEGTINAGTSWRQTQVNGVIGTNNVVWIAYGAASAATTSAAGVVQLATQTIVDTGTNTTQVITPSTLASAKTVAHIYRTDIGDGSSTSYTVTHSLGTRDVIVSVFENAGSRQEVIVDVQHTSTSAITVVFASAPAASAYRVVVMGASD
jgi:hypothetical protein